MRIKYFTKSTFLKVEQNAKGWVAGESWITAFKQF